MYISAIEMCVYVYIDSFATSKQHYVIHTHLHMHMDTRTHAPDSNRTYTKFAISVQCEYIRGSNKKCITLFQKFIYIIIMLELTIILFINQENVGDYSHVEQSRGGE